MSTMDRRKFLHIVTVTASATALGLTGCSSDSNSPAPITTPTAPSVVLAEARYPQGVASGDPRPNAVLVWTRVSGLVNIGTLRLQVATDSGFSQLLVNSDFGVSDASDHCLKVRVIGLNPGTTYYYRFLLAEEGSLLSSATGRTRTAREITDSTPLKFAFISCQDYIGKFYNSLLPLLDQDLDFVLHLGDSIYETTGDPAFQSGGAGRGIQFRQPELALRLGTGEGAFLAARTLDNYRDLHRAYRSDDAIKAIYQRFPVISIWDDHEFSDDAWKDNGTYLDGRFEERDSERRRNAEQAYFEFTPVDTDLGGTGGRVEVVRDALFPNTVLYRKLRFGRDVELFLTDYRSFRPDHLIPEDAFPGTVIMDRAALTQVLALAGVPYEAVRNNFSAYLNIDRPAYAVYKQVLLAALTVAYLDAGLETGQATLRAQTAISGNLSTTVINTLVQQYNAAVPANQQVPLLPQALIDTLDTGIAWFTLGKTSPFGNIGSRYFVVKDTYDLYATYRLLTAGGATQDAWGSAQTQWLVSQVASSTARWKIIATSVAFTSMVLDLTNPALGVPAPFNQRFYLNVDQWDGFPQQRDILLRQALGNVPGLVFLSGDIHAGFATVHPGASQTHVEFTTAAVSSAPFRTLLQNSADSDPLLRPIAGGLIPATDQLLLAGNSAIRYVQTDHHGVSVAVFSADDVRIDMLEFQAARANSASYNSAVVPDRVRSFGWNGSELSSLSG
ncbi:alkaline phosphatase D family protein [Pseudomarimonas arenosa]|uniref:Alkaline phosphatase D family protein n=1 Tax=Pseudomarimonas arenosa TaxID=2774145 RepID=A0AAW3ZIG0_9GAMM|nr:alkaline phosphatase D family protein [Pseudomarimonas arenosa]MBD8524467.1 alkaline phosphatase D family protein [Pseudomarimonas arenosa]